MSKVFRTEKYLSFAENKEDFELHTTWCEACEGKSGVWSPVFDSYVIEGYLVADEWCEEVED